jgi:hypothetical protein
MAKHSRDRLSPKRLKNDTVARELVSSDTDATRNTRLPVPSPNPATNLVIAEIIVRGASILFRRSVEKRVAKASYGDEDRAREVLNGRTILSTVALYGAGRVAASSRTGLGLVASALVAKTLYDRGRQVQRGRAGRRLDSADG